MQQPSAPQHPQQPQPTAPHPRPGMPDDMDVPENKLLRYVGVTFVSVILALFVLFILDFLTRKSRPVRVSEPLIQERFVFRPEFESADGKFPAGTAFAVKRSGDPRAIVLTAVNLFSPRGKFPREIDASELPTYITGVNLNNAFADGALLGHCSKVIPIPHAAAAPKESQPGDVAAFLLDPDANVRPMPLGTTNPEVGDTIWMIARVLKGAKPEDRKMHRAYVTGYDEGDILYRYENSKLDLVATSGAPLVNAQGEVIGIHIGPAGGDGELLGFGNPVERFAPFVKLPPLEKPKDDQKKPKVERPKTPVVRPPKPKSS